MASRKRHFSSPENLFRKKTKYASKFQEKWKMEIEFIESSERGDSFAFCKLCKANFSVVAGGGGGGGGAIRFLK